MNYTRLAVATGGILIGAWLLAEVSRGSKYWDTFGTPEQSQPQTNVWPAEDTARVSISPAAPKLQ